MTQNIQNINSIFVSFYIQKGILVAEWYSICPIFTTRWDEILLMTLITPHFLLTYLLLILECSLKKHYYWGRAWDKSHSSSEFSLSLIYNRKDSLQMCNASVNDYDKHFYISLYDCMSLGLISHKVSLIASWHKTRGHCSSSTSSNEAEFPTISKKSQQNNTSTLTLVSPSEGACVSFHANMFILFYKSN